MAVVFTSVINAEDSSKNFSVILLVLLFISAIRHEIQDIEDGKMDRKINPLKVRYSFKGCKSRYYVNTCRDMK